MTDDPAEQVRAQLQGVRHQLQQAAQQLQPYRNIAAEECGSEPLAAAVRGLITRVAGPGEDTDPAIDSHDGQDGPA